MTVDNETGNVFFQQIEKSGKEVNRAHAFSIQTRYGSNDGLLKKESYYSRYDENTGELDYSSLTVATYDLDNKLVEGEQTEYDRDGVPFNNAIENSVAMKETFPREKTRR